MLILNLGCGTKTSDKSGVVNIDWSIYLRLKRSVLLRPFVPFVVSGERRARFARLADSIVVHNLAKGIPFADDSVDVVYHSHMLEHLDREVASHFLIEARRVLKPGGIHRIVVPDFEQACRAYLAHVAACEQDPAEVANHDSYVGELLEQSVRREAAGTSQQRWFRRIAENMLLGDARRRGETHQWMYDRFNLKNLLIKCGYNDVSVQSYNTSQIVSWAAYGLDVNDTGTQYKPGSLYVEARK